MQKLLKSNKKYLTFVVTIIGIGLLFGVIYYHFLESSVQENIILTLSNFTNFEYNAILKDLIIMSLTLVLSFIVIGTPLSIFYLFYESFSIGFLINIFFAAYKLKGLLYIILYLIINKLLTIILIIFFIRKIINISRLIIGLIIYKNDNIIKNKLIINFKNSLYIIIFTLIINSILYFISPYITEYLSFLLK